MARAIPFWEAIAQVMNEEMCRDASVYLMGAEVSEYKAAYKTSKGLLEEFGLKRVIDAHIGLRFFRHWHWVCEEWQASGHRVYDLQNE